MSVESSARLPQGLDLVIENGLPVRNGNEKIVYPVRWQGELCAAKIFKDKTDMGEPVAKAQASAAEFAAYTATHDSPIGIFVPEPKILIPGTTGSSVGLVVAWRNGDCLSATGESVKVPGAHFEALRKALMALPPGLHLEIDTLSHNNICWDGSSLWLAEPRLDNHEPEDKWRLIIEQQIDQLLKNYAD